MPTTILKPPSLGPLVGHTTENTARIWIRGVDTDDSHRTIGVGAIFEKGARPEDDRLVPNSTRYFRLHRDFDRTGTIDFVDLKPGTAYKARLGCLVLESADSDLLVDDEDVFARLPASNTWEKELLSLSVDDAEADFKTFPTKHDEPLKFAFGSCRYPGLFTRKKSDFIYGTIERYARERNYQFLLLVGDQIYADEFNRVVPVGKADSESEFHDRYVEAFGSPNQRSLMQRLPTYMILDDHEIEDNWINGRIFGDTNSRALFNMAIQAYLSYQWVHGPRQQWDPRRTSAKYLYYSFECMGFPFFVLDERSQRIKEVNDTNLSDNHLLGMPAKKSVDGWVYEGQLERFCNWLVDQQKKVGDRPKFVVSASVFVPNDVSELKNPNASDSWPAFPETRRVVLEAIVKGQVQNVVFLGGDVHCSSVAEIRFEGTPAAEKLKAFSITSSAFYWPFPFADGDPNTFVHDSKSESDEFLILNGTVAMHYEARGFEQEDNFTEVTVHPDMIEIGVINLAKDGKILQSHKLKLKELRRTARKST